MPMLNGKVNRYDAKINALFRLTDNILILGSAFLVGDWLISDWDSHAPWLLILLLLFYNYFAESQHVYKSWRGGSLTEEISSIIIAWSLSELIVLSLFLFVLDRDISTKMDYFWLISFVIIPALITGFHIGIRLLLAQLRRKGFNTRTVAIYGATPIGMRLARTLDEMPWSGFNLVGFYDDRVKRDDERRESIHLLGDVKQLIADAHSSKFERVYIAISLSAEQRTKTIIKELADTTVSVYYVPDMFVFDLLHAKIEDYKGVPAVSIYESPFSGVNAFTKRAEDILIGSLILLLISIPMIIIALGIKFTSKGPVLFKQARYGRSGERIDVWKFRSMTVMENSDQVTQATKNDQRITPFGAFLRRTSLDELPQFFNVIQGSMSIVGPRPHAVAHNEAYRKLIPGYMLRHKIKPGITGWAQIHGYRGETDTLDKMEMRVRYDLEYIRSWSLSLDLKIILLTIFKGFVHKNAY
jgi:putative colanic acid biosynthesis UDP-glucose lipid carrier transferase